MSTYNHNNTATAINPLVGYFEGLVNTVSELICGR